jgi:hypothetical protein
MNDYKSKNGVNADNWKNIPNLKIISMNYNQNNTLLVLATNYGYRILDVLNDFQLISTVDESQKELGPLKKAKILYKSSLIGFIGEKENERFKENTFYFYSDEYKKILSKITFSQNIKDFYISSSLLFICFVTNIYVFELHSMRYIHNIQHCLFTEKLISIVEDPLEETEDEDYLTNNKVITIGYVTSYQNEIRIQRYIINKNIPNFVIKDSVKSDFNECPEMIKLIKGLKIIVVSKNGNKLHIYDYVNNSLLYCLYLGNDTYNINDINLGIKNKFLMIYYKVYQIDIIKMDKDLKKVKCTCSDDNNKFIYKRLKTFDFNNKSKINNVYSSGTIINKGKYLEYLCQFDPKKKDIINVVNNGGFLTVYQFDRKQEGDKFKTLKNVCLFEEDLTEF